MAPIDLGLVDFDEEPALARPIPPRDDANIETSTVRSPRTERAERRGRRARGDLATQEADPVPELISTAPPRVGASLYAHPSVDEERKVSPQRSPARKRQRKGAPHLGRRSRIDLSTVDASP